MLTNVNQRLNYFIKSKGISKRSIESALSFSNGYISKTKNYGEEHLKAIFNLFPELNVEWITTGKGEMINQLKVVEAKPKSIETENVFFTKNGVKCIQLEDGTYKMEIKHVTQKAHLGYKNGFSDPEFIEELPSHTIYVDEIKRGFYRAFDACGDSMYDPSNAESIKDKAVVVGRNIAKVLWRDKLHIKQWNEFIICTKYDGIMVKQIIDHDVNTGVITCHSYNPDKSIYPDFKMDLDEIAELYNVVEVTNPRK